MEFYLQDNYTHEYFHIHISQGTLISFIVFFRISISLPFDFCLMIFQRPREV